MDKKLTAKERFANLGRAGVILMRDMDEKHLLKTIAEVARDLTNAQYAASTMRSVDNYNHPLGPSNGNAFSLGAVTGVTPEEEKWFEHSRLGGKGLLAPIFHQGVSVLIPDLEHYDADNYLQYQMFSNEIGIEPLNAMSETRPPLPVGTPPGHPHIRSFLGVPLLSRNYEILGALLLGHSKPKRFDIEDEALLVGLAAQAAVALENTRLLKLSATVSDRERHVMEEYIQRQALGIILDELPGGVLVVQGDDAKMLMANHAATGAWGGTWRYMQPYADFLRENNIRVFDLRRVELESDQLVAMQVLRRGKSVHNYQEIIRLADGSEFPILMNAVTLNIGGWLGKIFAEMQGFDTGERIVVITHQDVSVLMEAERVKNEFIGIAAHELRSPLAVLHGFVQTLHDQSHKGHGAPLADWQEEALEGIDQSTMHMKLLVDDLLDVSRVQSGRLNLVIEPCNLVALARRVINRQQVTTQRHQINLHTDMEYLVVLADAQRTEQVLDNLLSNAIKYSPDGGPIDVHISIHTSRKRGRMGMLSVRDYGIGIPQDQQSRLFHRFQRADNAHSINGTGLGLYICRAIIEYQRGRIWFDSEEDKGSTFCVTLPLYEDEE